MVSDTIPLDEYDVFLQNFPLDFDAYYLDSIIQIEAQKRINDFDKEEEYTLFVMDYTDDINSALFYEYVKEYFKNLFDEDEVVLKKKEKIFENSFFRKVLEKEKMVLMRDFSTNLVLNMVELQKEKPTEKRLQLLKEIDSLSQRTAVLHHIQRSVQQALIMMITRNYLGSDVDAALPIIFNMERNLKSKIYTSLREEYVFNHLYIYKELSESELEEYKLFLQSEDGKWMIDSYKNSVIYAFHNMYPDLLKISEEKNLKK